MLKKILLSVCSGIIAASVVYAQFGSEVRALLPPYWIVGTIADTDSVKADGRPVDFYRTDEDLAAGHYAQGVVSGNTFILNGFAVWPAALIVGETYKVTTERRADNYGANSKVTISGKGWDEVTRMELKAGGGIASLETGPGAVKVPETPPKIKIWFGNRLYQKAIIDAGEKFIVSSSPKIRADVSIDPPYSVSNSITDYAIVIDPGTAASKTLALNAGNMSTQSFAAAGGLRAFTLQYTVGEEDKLNDGQHIISFTARSSGTVGLQTVAVETASVEVAGGPLHVIGTPLTFPSPFRIHTDKDITLQYVLSQDADIELTIYSVEGRSVKKFYCSKTAEGGSAGLNKVSWDGIRQDGLRAGAGVYVGSIVSRGENRLLAKFKVAIVE